MEIHIYEQLESNNHFYPLFENCNLIFIAVNTKNTGYLSNQVHFTLLLQCPASVSSAI